MTASHSYINIMRVVMYDNSNLNISSSNFYTKRGGGEGVQSQILKKNRSKYLFFKKMMPNS